MKYHWGIYSLRERMCLLEGRRSLAWQSFLKTPHNVVASAKLSELSRSGGANGIV
jgi:hypothetical protein